jgi:hypothetical protein
MQIDPHQSCTGWEARNGKEAINDALAQAGKQEMATEDIIGVLH